MKMKLKNEVSVSLSMADTTIQKRDIPRMKQIVDGLRRLGTQAVRYQRFDLQLCINAKIKELNEAINLEDDRLRRTAPTISDLRTGTQVNLMFLMPEVIGHLITEVSDTFHRSGNHLDPVIKQHLKDVQTAVAKVAEYVNLAVSSKTEAELLDKSDLLYELLMLAVDRSGSNDELKKIYAQIATRKSRLGICPDKQQCIQKISLI